MLSSCTNCKNWKNSCTTSDIKDYLIFKINFISFNSTLICESSWLIFKHLLMNMVRWIAVEVVVMIICFIEICRWSWLVESVFIEPFVWMTCEPFLCWFLHFVLSTEFKWLQNFNLRFFRFFVSILLFLFLFFYLAWCLSWWAFIEHLAIFIILRNFLIIIFFFYLKNVFLLFPLIEFLTRLILLIGFIIILDDFLFSSWSLWWSIFLFFHFALLTSLCVRT